MKASHLQIKAERPAKMNGLPFVFINMAMTADGKIATQNRAISSFGSKRDHEHLLELRATADAVLSGARTVDSNQVDLGPGQIKFRRLRLRNGLAEYNLRVIVSGSGSVDPAAYIFKKKFSPVLVLTTSRASRVKLKNLREVATAVHVSGDVQIDFSAALSWLSSEWGINRLLCEGGGEVNDALFRQGLVHELHLTVCPKIFGGRWAPTIADGVGAACLADATPLRFVSSRRFKDELFLTYQVIKEG
jgi:2,5-diamino-6-(ribosylamino)-4(3H)-pyrimidinone 5'-phosphate reductase